jgi:hypothetical protein
MKTIKKLAITPGRLSGSVTRKNANHGGAPLIAAASSNDRSIRCNDA